MTSGTYTINDLEWLLSQHFNVHRSDQLVIVPFDDDLRVFAYTLTSGEQQMAMFNVLLGADMQPSPALYRWVATKGDLVVGSLYARVTDDALVDVHLDHAVHMEVLTADVAQDVVLRLVGSAGRLRGDIRDLFV